MALRTLVTGSDMCTGSDGAGPSNAVGALVNQLLGGASKTQEQLRDVRFLLLMLTTCMRKIMQQLTGHQNMLYCFLAAASTACARSTTPCSNVAHTRGSCSSSGRGYGCAWHGSSLSIGECHKHCIRGSGSNSTPPLLAAELWQLQLHLLQLWEWCSTKFSCCSCNPTHLASSY